MSEHTHFHHCQRCGARVGVYEPARVELADGTVVRGSMLAVAPERAREIARVWHRACVDADVEAPEE